MKGRLQQMDNIEDWVESGRKLDKIRREMDYMLIGLGQSHRGQLLLLVNMYMEYAEWMYQKGKHSARLKCGSYMSDKEKQQLSKHWTRYPDLLLEEIFGCKLFWYQKVMLRVMDLK